MQISSFLPNRSFHSDLAFPAGGKVFPFFKNTIFITIFACIQPYTIIIWLGPAFRVTELGASRAATALLEKDANRKSGLS
jgi:hypothetical protein